MKMDRREFLKTAAGAATLIALPLAMAQAYEKSAPRTVAELRTAVEALFSKSDEINADPEFGELLAVDFYREVRDVKPYRIVPLTWRKRGPSEILLVRAAWSDMLEVAKAFGRGELLWHKLPHFSAAPFFEDRPILRFEVAILPHDWKEMDGRSLDLSTEYPNIFTPEGYRAPVI